MPSYPPLLIFSLPLKERKRMILINFKGVLKSRVLPKLLLKLVFQRGDSIRRDNGSSGWDPTRSSDCNNQVSERYIFE